MAMAIRRRPIEKREMYWRRLTDCYHTLLLYYFALGRIRSRGRGRNILPP